MKDNLIKKFMQFGMGNIIVLMLGFISSPLITRLISPEQMGKFSMFSTVCNLLLIICTLGLDQSYVRFFFEEEEQLRGSLLRKSISIPIKISVLISIIMLFFYKYISRLIVGKETLDVILIMIIHIFFSVLGRFGLLVVRMQQKAKLYSKLQVLGKLSYILLTIGSFVIFRDNYITLMMALTLSNVIVVSVSIYLEKNSWNLKADNLDNNVVLKTNLTELIRYGTPLIFSTAIVWIFQSIDKITLNTFSGYEELGMYTAAFSIVSLLNALKNTFTTFWVPVANEHYISNPDDTSFYIQANKIVSFCMLIVGVILIGFKDIIILLLGSKYKESVFIFPFLVFIPIMYTISETTVIGIGFKKKNKYHIYISFISALINILGNMILVKNLGAKGAAISTGVAYIVFFYLRTYFSNKVYKVNYCLGRFYISILMLSILALYSTIYTINLTSIIITTLSIIIICYLYKDILNIFINKFNYILEKGKNNNCKTMI